jgi:hypothetical protein
MDFSGDFPVFWAKIKDKNGIDKVNPIWQNGTRFSLAKLNTIFRKAARGRERKRF